MLIEGTSKYLLKKTRAKAKMFEYFVPDHLHINVESNVPELLLIAIGTIGDIAAQIIRSKSITCLSEPENEEKISFASNFLNAFLESRLDEEDYNYYYLFGSVAFYFSNKLGSSQVLISKIDISNLNFDANGIEKALALLLKNDVNEYEFNHYSDFYNELISDIMNLIHSNNSNEVITDFSVYDHIRRKIYSMGSPLEILLVDSIIAIIIVKQNNLACNALPIFSDLSYSQWEEAIAKGKLIKELWPSQIQLGKLGAYKGTSSVIQMATGTGKTKSISLMIYSAFLAERSKLSIVVAPFRSLCREIAYNLEKDFKFDDNIKIEQLSDVLLDDFTLNTDNENIKSVVVLTPEKLMFVIRQQEGLINYIDQIIFDEAHLFDDIHRGTEYELLISLLRKNLLPETQKILISAVMSNAEQLNEWINGEDGVVISNNTIKSTAKQVGFTDWQYSSGTKYGYLYFVDPENPEIEEFYVPRLIEIKTLDGREGETKIRTFPEINSIGKSLNNDISIYYAIHLCRNGAVAIFCGKKNSANNIIKRLLEIKSRGYDIGNILGTSDLEEVNKIASLIAANYGEDNIYYRGAKEGLFVHHAGVSNGIKIASEYAMQKSLISFIVCTSTLAQGVNLPIKYLIVTSLYQGKEHISVRDFHNLIGRAGRSGVYTEGSILLTETGIYKSNNNHWKWMNYKRILNVENAEPCLSTLIDLVKDHSLRNIGIFRFYEYLVDYYVNKEEFDEFNAALNNINNGDQLRYMLHSYINTLSSIESFILANFEFDSDGYNDSKLIELLEETYGYYLASDDEKERLINLFSVIGEYIIKEVSDVEKRYTYSKSLLGIKLNKMIEEWIVDHYEILHDNISEALIFDIISPLLYENNETRKVEKIEMIQCFIDIGKLWISGKTYKEILDYCIDNEYKIESRNRLKLIDLGDVIEICEKGLGYSTILLITGIAELYSNMDGFNENTYNTILNLSSELRYGLPDQVSIYIYEIGFSDRVIAQKISDEMQIPSNLDEKKLIRNFLRTKKEQLLELLHDYPTIFTDRASNL